MLEAVLLTALLAQSAGPAAAGAAAPAGRALIERARERLDALRREKALLFEVVSEYQGFLGGHSPGRVGRPSETLVAHVTADGTVVGRLGPVVVVRRADAYVGRDDVLDWLRLGRNAPARHRSEFSVLRHLYTPADILAMALEEGPAFEVSAGPTGSTVRWTFGDRASRRLAGVLARPRRGQLRRPGTFRARCEAQIDADGALSSLDVDLVVRTAAGPTNLAIRRHVTYRVWFQEEAGPDFAVPPGARALLDPPSGGTERAPASNSEGESR